IVKDGGVFTMRYDAAGRCNFSTGLNRFDEKRLRFYDAAMFVEVIDSIGSIWRYKRLASGQISEEIGPTGTVRKTVYDEFFRIVTIIDEMGGATGYTYDDVGNRVSITNAAGHTYRLGYNAARQPVCLLDPKGGLWLHVYDSANRLVRSTDP